MSYLGATAALQGVRSQMVSRLGKQIFDAFFISDGHFFQLDETPQMVLIMLDGAVNQVFASIIITREVLVFVQDF